MNQDTCTRRIYLLIPALLAILPANNSFALDDNLAPEFALTSNALAVLSLPAGSNSPLNDTGIRLCGDYAAGYSKSHQNTIVCSEAGASTTTGGIDSDGDPVPAGQDAVHGRDADLTSNANRDGNAGFSFTKLDASGNPLAAAAKQWVCIKDNVTGLVWEVKTDNNLQRDKDWTYSWYSIDTTTNGGVTGFSDQADNCHVATRCDTANYVAYTNTSHLCGFSNWRLPSTRELLSITTNDRQPAINSHYFRWASGPYWSSGTYASLPDFAWVIYDHGGTGYAPKSENYHVRLVSSNE